MEVEVEVVVVFTLVVGVMEDMLAATTTLAAVVAVAAMKVTATIIPVSHSRIIQDPPGFGLRTTTLECTLKLSKVMVGLEILVDSGNSQMLMVTSGATTKED